VLALRLGVVEFCFNKSFKLGLDKHPEEERRTKMKLYIRELSNGCFVVCDEGAGFEGRGDSTAAVFVDGVRMVFPGEDKAMQVMAKIVELVESGVLRDVGDERVTVLKVVKGQELELGWTLEV